MRRDRRCLRPPVGAEPNTRTHDQEAAMLLTNVTPKAVVITAGVIAALAVVPAASARTFVLSGRQIAVDENAGKFRVTGSLVGRWDITRFDTLATSPLVQAQGTETFTGCLDRGAKGCGRGDPKGTLHFSFTYEASFASPDPVSLVWGSCRHPVVSGSGAFAGAKGVVAMVDTPTARGVRTDYIGNLTLPGGRAAVRPARANARASSATAPCGGA